MRLSRVLICLLFAVPALADTFVINNVNVISMTSPRVMEKQTVLVRDGRIESVSAMAKAAKDATVIDGTGKYLIPGLADMHAHIPPVETKTGLLNDTLVMFVASGVTTVRGMLGEPDHLKVRDQANRGEIVSPMLYLAGPPFSDETVASAQEVVDRVHKQKKEGWDLLKVHFGLTPDQYEALAKTAREDKMRFGGHVPAAVGLMRAIALGQETFEHMDGFVEYLDGTKGPVSEKPLEEVVKKSKEAGIWVVPTSAYWEIVYGATPLEKLTAYPELKYSPPPAIEYWTNEYNKRVAQIPRAAAANVVLNRRRILRALHEGGVKILVGTDSIQEFTEPGFSVAREMESMVAAGLSPYDVLRAATVNAAEYLGKKDSMGTIEAGKRADLVLLDENPLANVSNVSKVRGVFVGGKWYPREQLDIGLERIVQKYNRGASPAQ